MAKHPDDDLQTDARDLIEFWSEIMKGKILAADSQGNLKESIVPIEIRLRASELLAKYTVPTKGKTLDEKEITATPDILRVAHMLESDARYSDEDIRRALELTPEGSA